MTSCEMTVILTAENEAALETARERMREMITHTGRRWDIALATDDAARMTAATASRAKHICFWSAESGIAVKEAEKMLLQHLGSRRPVIASRFSSQSIVLKRHAARYWALKLRNGLARLRVPSSPQDILSGCMIFERADWDAVRGKSGAALFRAFKKHSGGIDAVPVMWIC